MKMRNNNNSHDDGKNLNMTIHNPNNIYSNSINSTNISRLFSFFCVSFTIICFVHRIMEKMRRTKIGLSRDPKHWTLRSLFQIHTIDHQRRQQSVFYFLAPQHIHNCQTRLLITRVSPTAWGHTIDRLKVPHSAFAKWVLGKIMEIYFLGFTSCFKI